MPRHAILDDPFDDVRDAELDAVIEVRNFGELDNSGFVPSAKGDYGNYPVKWVMPVERSSERSPEREAELAAEALTHQKNAQQAAAQQQERLMEVRARLAVLGIEIEWRADEGVWMLAEWPDAPQTITGMGRDHPNRKDELLFSLALIEHWKKQHAKANTE